MPQGNLIFGIEFSFYYSVLTHSNAFPKNADSKIHISNPYTNLLDLRILEGGNLVYIYLLNLSNDLVPQDNII